MKNQTLTIIIVLIFLSFTIIVLPYLELQSFTIVDISKLTVLPQGEEVEGIWTGSFWSIEAYVTSSESVQGFMAVAENQSYTIEIEGTKYDLRSGANIEIVIDPEQPYFVRTIRSVLTEVVPSTYQSGMHKITQAIFQEKGEGIVDDLWCQHFDWAEPGWRWYCPYWITVLKDGEEIGRKLLNSEGEDSIQIVETSEGPIRIEHLGMLSGEYKTVEVPEQIAIFDKSYVYDYQFCSPYMEYDKGVQFQYCGHYLCEITPGSTNAYSTYWYGPDYRWDDDLKPAGFAGRDPYFGMIDERLYGGWTEEDSTWVWKRNPLRPVIFPHDKYILPTEKQHFRCLTEYLEYKGATNIATTIFDRFERWELQEDEVKIYIPWGAYGTPLVHFLVPTELADTFVYRPTISDVEITDSYWKLTGGKHTDLYGSQRIAVELYQKAEVKSSCEVKIKPSTEHVSVFPLRKILTLEPGERMVTTFDLTNLGVESEISGFVTLQVYELWGHSLTSEDMSLTYKLMPQTTEKAILDLLVVDKETQKGVVGIHVFIQYGVEFTKEGFSDTHGKVGPFDLGDYRGTVQISTGETATYKPAYRTVTVSGGYNSFTIELLKHGEEDGDEPWPWWALLLGIAVPVSAGAIAYMYFFGKPRKRR